MSWLPDSSHDGSRGRYASGGTILHLRIGSRSHRFALAEERRRVGFRSRSPPGPSRRGSGIAGRSDNWRTGGERARRRSGGRGPHVLQFGTRARGDVTFVIRWPSDVPDRSCGIRPMLRQIVNARPENRPCDRGPTKTAVFCVRLFRIGSSGQADALISRPLRSCISRAADLTIARLDSFLSA